MIRFFGLFPWLFWSFPAKCFVWVCFPPHTQRYRVVVRHKYNIIQKKLKSAKNWAKHKVICFLITKSFNKFKAKLTNSVMPIGKFYNENVIHVKSMSLVKCCHWKVNLPTLIFITPNQLNNYKTTHHFRSSCLKFQNKQLEGK